MFTALANAKRRMEKETGAERCPEYKIVSEIVLLLFLFFCLFCFCLFVFFPVSINSPRSLCKRLSFLLKTEPVSKAASTHIQILLKT